MKNDYEPAAATSIPHNSQAVESSIADSGSAHNYASSLFYADPMDGRTNPWAVGTATIMNAGIVALLILAGLRSAIHDLPAPHAGTDIHLQDFTLVAPALEPAKSDPSHGGGGGGANALTDPVTGRLPRREEMPLVPPQVPLIQNPKLAIDSAIAVPPDVKLPDDPTLPNIGVHSTAIVKLASNGPGTHTGIGGGSNGGDGPGNGPGTGPGSDRSFGGSVYSPGVGGVSRPTLVFSPEAEFSDEARRQKYQGVCIISIVVDAQGNPRNLRISRSLGMGLDEKAMEAVQKYRFKPALKDGKAVASFASVEVDFHLY